MKTKYLKKHSSASLQANSYLPPEKQNKVGKEGLSY